MVVMIIFVTNTCSLGAEHLKLMSPQHEGLSKHNALWDAYVIRACYNKLQSITPNTMNESQALRGVTYEEEVTKNKQLRKDTDDIIQKIKDLPSSRERSLAITKLQEGVMWLGMDLKRLGEANPYPSSKDASTGTVIEPTADGLKM